MDLPLKMQAASTRVSELLLSSFKTMRLLAAKYNVKKKTPKKPPPVYIETSVQTTKQEVVEHVAQPVTKARNSLTGSCTSGV